MIEQPIWETMILARFHHVSTLEKNVVIKLYVHTNY